MISSSTPSMAVEALALAVGLLSARLSSIADLMRLMWAEVGHGEPGRHGKGLAPDLYDEDQLNSMKSSIKNSIEIEIML